MRGSCGAGAGARHAMPGGRHGDSIAFYFQRYAAVRLFNPHSNNLSLNVNN